MQLRDRPLLGLLAAFFLMATLSSFSFAQSKQNQFFRPIDGSRMVVGDGQVPDYVLDCFLRLCDSASADVVVVCLEGEPRVSLDRWKQRGARSVHFVDSISNDLQELTTKCLQAEGVWFEGSMDSLNDQPLLKALFHNVAKKSGVLAFDSGSVPVVSELEKSADAELSIPSSLAKCKFHFDENLSNEIAANGKDAANKVHWVIPQSTALVIHHGRAITAYGEGEITVFVPAARGWPVRKRTLESIDVFGENEVPSYSMDLLSWVRSAAQRERAVFPAVVAPSPNLEKGTLVLHGGSGVSDEIFEEFINAAGGKDAPIVCIPSASSFDAVEDIRSYSAGRLADLGCSNVSVLHTDDPLVAERNERFSRALENAKGVWIDGGRTYRFMDCYQGTRVESLLHQVLNKGGVVGGSSAGCQVSGDFLVRGNPTTNQAIVHEGYTEGMGLIGGVIIDAHFLQRNRHEPFLGLMEMYPQMLGVGIDEKTALIVKGQTGRVMGPNAVSFYHMNGQESEGVSPQILHSGETYDLKLRKKVK